MKALFTGTDSLMLIDVSKRSFKKKVYWIVFRVLIRLLDRFVEEYYCDSENVANNLRKFGVSKNVSVNKDKLLHTEKYEKKAHKGFNVIYYIPDSVMEKSFMDWLYGRDVIEKVKRYLTVFKGYDINFLELDGSYDMKDVFHVSDFYIRPNRSDGSSRLRQECEIQDIPYYWSTANPCVSDAIKLIEDEYKKRT